MLAWRAGCPVAPHTEDSFERKNAESLHANYVNQNVLEMLWKGQKTWNRMKEFE